MQGTGRDGAAWRRGTSIDRRRMMGTMALAGAGASFALACGGSGKTAETSATTGPAGSSTGAPAAQETPKPGGIYRAATITQTPHFSPFHPGADPSYVNTWRRVNGYYEVLWYFKSVQASAKDRLVMRLAQSVEQPDEATYIAKMNPSRFHNRAPANGRDVASEDVAATVQFLTKPPASGGAFLQSGKDLKAVSAVDPLTVKFETFGPRGFFYTNGGGERVIVPKEMLDEQTLKTSIPVGSGPFQYKSHTQGSIEEVGRFENYFKKPMPYPDGKKLTFVPDDASTEAAFRSGQIDAISFTDIKQRDTIKKDLGGQLGTKDFVTTTGMCLMVNINRAPWSDARVREAIYRAVDVDRMINVVYFGDAQRSWYYSPASVTRNPVKWDEVKQYVDYDPKKAAGLLKAAGIDPNHEYEFMVPVENQQWVDAGRLFAEDLAKVGLKTRVNPVVRNIYLQRAGPKPGDFDITMSVFLDWQYAQTHSGTFWDSSSLQDPEVDAIIEKISQTVDPTAQDKLWHDFQIMLAQKYSNLLPLIALNAHYGWYSYVKGFDDNFDYFANWQDNLWINKA